MIRSREAIEDDGLARALVDTADPDQALLGAVRLAEAAGAANDEDLSD